MYVLLPQRTSFQLLHDNQQRRSKEYHPRNVQIIEGVPAILKAGIKHVDPHSLNIRHPTSGSTLNTTELQQEKYVPSSVGSLLVVRLGAPSSILAPSSDARSP